MKHFRTMLSLLLAAVLTLSLAACGRTAQEPPAQTEPAGPAAPPSGTETPEPPASNETPADSPGTPAADEPADTGSRILVVYFSASGNTRRVAEAIADAVGGDLFELTPAEPYTSDDLNWRQSGSRVNREHDDESLREVALVSTEVENWDDYETVFLGYPIWWGIAAWPVDTFVKANDFTGKTVIPFATSSSSGLGESGTLLAELAGTGDWQEGQRFRSSASDEDVAAWAAGLGL